MGSFGARGWVCAVLASGLAASGEAVAASVKGGAELDDNFGAMLATGDFDCNGVADLVVGAPWEQDSVGLRPAVHILFNGGTSDQLWQPASGAVSGTWEREEMMALVVGHFDSDACDDLAVALPSEYVSQLVVNGNLLSYQKIETGAVHILHGSAAGLVDTGERWHQDSPGILGRAEPYDFFGQGLSKGDFDGNGYDDLAIAIPGNAGPGELAILYGTSAGLSAVGDSLWDPGSLSLDEDGEGFYGVQLAAGDFNGDGYGDLAMGLPYTSRPDIGFNVGMVHVLYGAAGGLTATGGLSPYQTEGDADEDTFGRGLAVGDFDADDCDDLAIGSRERVHVAYGGTAGLSATPELEGSGFYSHSLATGSFDGDEYDDLALGDPAADMTQFDDGAVHVLYGAADGLSSSRSQLWHEDVVGVVDVNYHFQFFGYALAAGDLDDNGVDDLAVGVPGEKINTYHAAGQVHVLFGTSVSGITDVGDLVWNQDSTLLP